MTEENLPSLKFKKTISTSTKFLKDIWRNHGNNQSQDEECAGHFYNNVKCSNENLNQKSNSDLDFPVHDNVKPWSDNGVSHNQDDERQKRRSVAMIENFRLSSKACDISNTFNATNDLDSDIPMTDPVWTPDNLLTDELLDEMLIQKVHDKKKLSYFYMQSRVLYKYLSSEIGSEYIIKFRWKVLEKEISTNFFGIPMIISGSRAEGLNMSGSDIDMMLSMAKAHEGRESANDDFNFIYNSLDYEECPGYVTVMILIKGQTEETLFSSDWKNILLAVLPFTNASLAYGIHGPSLSGTFFGLSFDQVSCLKSQTWPKIAEEWIFRKRHFGWPTTEMVSAIVSTGCHIVPISSKVDQSDGKEWRLSFSIAEKKLIRSFNHVQILIYGLLKIVLKEIIEKEESLKDLLCSYFLKTTLLWLIEETRQELWNPKYTLLCYKLCIKRLIRYVMDDYCPNYFVPINNMFLGRFSQSKKELLLHTLFNSCDQGLKWTDLSSTMGKLIKYMRDPFIVFEINELQRRAEKEETFSLTLSYLMLCKACIFLFRKQRRLLPFTRSLFKEPLLRKSLTHIFAHFIDTNDSTMSNKDKYSCEQIVLNMLLHKSEMDHISRDSMLASWLYRAGKFNDCLNVLDIALMSLKRTVAKEFTEIPESIDQTIDINQILKLYTTLSVHLPMVSHIIPTKLLYFGRKLITSPFMSKYIRNNPTDWCFYPEQYFYFMKCLCHLKLGDDESFNHGLMMMTDINLEGNTSMLIQMVLKIVLQLTKRGEKDFFDIVFEEMNSFSISSFTNCAKKLIFQGLNSDIDNQVFNTLHWFNGTLTNLEITNE